MENLRIPGSSGVHHPCPIKPAQEYDVHTMRVISGIHSRNCRTGVSRVILNNLQTCCVMYLLQDHGVLRRSRPARKESNWDLKAMNESQDLAN